ncbi:NAD(P)H-dependent glycerol-3-phosphate dehydrogenase [Pseudoclavibacter sp. CFCC 13611]|uniref:NAD(P)H-dependent glycerol-3-phosphate dehydrogenase n=1 Tax=Pseudoclavibacter sp. CFCC 13611 TaxID=2615178 RepID=UPI001787F71C|nr:NAD(P)H-dependent glycerol-3-phosphate dehydrogenase [Pseudoclavibacter sp. CFCC 13611]
MIRAAVVGAGSWGTTFAKVLADAGCETTVLARRNEVAAQINEQHRNEQYLPDVTLPETLHATTDPSAALSRSDLVFLSVPSQQLRASLSAIGEHLPSDAVLVSLIKGLERGTMLRMSEVLVNEIDWDIARLGVLSGPNIAGEIASEQPAAAAVASTDLALAEWVAQHVTNPYFSAFANDDVVGTEYGGVLKNLIALAVGIVAGVGYGENTKAAIITRGLEEISRFAVAFGGRPETLVGLAGLGDLIATCESPLSRNHTAGRLLGQGHPLDEVVHRMQQTAEGIGSVRPVLDLAREHGVEMPIVSQVAQVLDGRMNPADLTVHITPRNEEALADATAGGDKIR